MSKAFDPSEHPRATDGTFKDAGDKTPGTLPPQEDSIEEAQRQQARDEYPQLRELMSSEYARLYDSHDQDYNYRKAVIAFDQYAHEHPYEIGEFISQRGDFIDSDREAAAFMFAKWQMNGEIDIPDTSVVSNPFMRLSDRADRCIQYQKALDSGDLETAEALDSDGAMEMMTKAGYSYGNPNADFKDLTSPEGEESVEWAVDSFKARHPDYNVDYDAVNARIQAEISGDEQQANAIDEEYPDANYIMNAAEGNLHPDDSRTIYAADYEDMLLSHELSEPTSMYVQATRRLSMQAAHHPLKPGDPCWRTYKGWVSDKDFNRAFNNSQLLADRYVVYAAGSDDDRRMLETDKWNDQVWLANKASECEDANRSSILYRTAFPNISE